MKKRCGTIDLFKFVFAVIILLFHGYRLGAEGQNTIFSGGSIAVEFYFIVSGYLLAASADKYKLSDAKIGEYTTGFMKNKICRLYPEVLIAFLIAFFVRQLSMGLESLLNIEKILLSIWDMLLISQTGIGVVNITVVTWYLSAMLLSMYILFPLMLKNQEVFLNIIAPLTSFFILGWISQNIGHLRAPTRWLGFCYNGFLRSTAELCLGCMCWELCNQIKKFRFSVVAKVLLSIVEFSGYIFVIIWSYSKGASHMDFVLLMILAISVTISFSGEGIVAQKLNHKFFYKLGDISFSIYLGHYFWTRVLTDFFPEKTYTQLMLIYIGLASVTILVIYNTSNFIRNRSGKIKNICRKFFLEPL